MLAFQTYSAFLFVVLHKQLYSNKRVQQLQEWKHSITFFTTFYSESTNKACVGVYPGVSGAITLLPLFSCHLQEEASAKSNSSHSSEALPHLWFGCTLRPFGQLLGAVWRQYCLWVSQCDGIGVDPAECVAHLDRAWTWMHCAMSSNPSDMKLLFVQHTGRRATKAECPGAAETCPFKHATWTGLRMQNRIHCVHTLYRRCNTSPTLNDLITQMNISGHGLLKTISDALIAYSNLTSNKFTWIESIKMFRYSTIKSGKIYLHTTTSQITGLPLGALESVQHIRPSIFTPSMYCFPEVIKLWRTPSREDAGEFLGGVKPSTVFHCVHTAMEWSHASLLFYPFSFPDSLKQKRANRACAAQDHACTYCTCCNGLIHILAHVCTHARTGWASTAWLTPRQTDTPLSLGQSL